VQKYLVLSAHIITPRLVVINEAFWQGLSAGDRKIIADAVKSGIAWQNAELIKQEGTLVDTLKAAGMTVITARSQRLPRAGARQGAEDVRVEVGPGHVRPDPGREVTAACPLRPRPSPRLMRVAPLAARSHRLAGDRDVLRNVRVRAGAGRLPLLPRRSADVERRARTIPVRVVLVPWAGSSPPVAAAISQSGRCPSVPRRALRALLALFAAAAALAFAAVLGFYGTRIMLRNLDVDTTTLFFTMGVVYAVVPLATSRSRCTRSPTGSRPCARSRGGRRTRMIDLIPRHPRRLVRRALRRPCDLRGDGPRGLRLPVHRRHSRHRDPAEGRDGRQLVPAPRCALFILMGNLMNSAGISYRIFDFAKAVVGWMRGGLCQANIIGSVIFAGMSGSAVADAAGLGTVEIEAMKKEGYDAETAAAITAASATIGPIIPPSLPMIVYGVAAETSIGGLFIAGVIPGLLMAVALMIMVRHLAIRQNMPSHPFEGTGALWIAFRRAFWALMAPVVLFGGLLSGIFTPTEAAAVAVTYALVLGLFVYRDFELRDLPRIILDTVETTGVVMALVMTASLLGYCISVSRLPQEFGTTLTSLTRIRSSTPHRQPAAARRRVLHGSARGHAGADPILVPPAIALGSIPLQFGLVFVLNLMIGTITPPVGVVLYVTAKVADVPFDRMARAVVPYLVPLLAVLAMITFWPPLTTWLPRLVLGR
jgi:tripartite ATP-independent transporter DctM subunit